MLNVSPLLLLLFEAAGAGCAAAAPSSAEKSKPPPPAAEAAAGAGGAVRCRCLTGLPLFAVALFRSSSNSLCSQYQVAFYMRLRMLEQVTNNDSAAHWSHLRHNRQQIAISNATLSQSL